MGADRPVKVDTRVVAATHRNLMQMVEEVKLKKNLLSELKKENIEFEAKLKQQQNLYEAVRSEKNLYSKNLLEAQDDVAELNRKFKIAQHQITQLKARKVRVADRPQPVLPSCHIATAVTPMADHMAGVCKPVRFLLDF